MILHEVFKRDGKIARTVEWFKPSNVRYIYTHYPYRVSFARKGNGYIFFSDDIITFRECNEWLISMEAGKVQTINIDLASVSNPVSQRQKAMSKKGRK